MNNNDTNERTLEERMDELEALIGQMEEENVSLEDSFALYKKGLTEIKEANAMLEEMEKAMLVMTENGDLEEF